MAKSTQTEVQPELSKCWIFDLRLLGKTMNEISQYGAEQGWNVGHRQLWKYAEQADAVLAEQLSASREKMFARHLGQRRTLYGIAMQQRDVKAALAVLRDEAELLGLYPAKRTELSGADGGPIQVESTVLNDHEQRAAFIAIMAACGDRPLAIGAHDEARGTTLDGTGNGNEPGGDAAGCVADYVTPIV